MHQHPRAHGPWWQSMSLLWAQEEEHIFWDWKESALNWFPGRIKWRWIGMFVCLFVSEFCYVVRLRSNSHDQVINLTQSLSS
jgi:hypothetical protein